MKKKDTLDHYKSVAKDQHGEYYDRLNPYILKQKPFLAGEVAKMLDAIMPPKSDRAEEVLAALSGRVEDAERQEVHEADRSGLPGA